MNRKLLAPLFAVGLIMAALFSGIIIYFNETIANMHSEINSFKAEISNEIAGKLETPYLVTQLGAIDKTGNGTYDENDQNTYNCLFIYGAVSNMGFSTAHNVGLHVFAMDSSGEVVINMTVPITAGTYRPEDNQRTFPLGDMLRQETAQTQVTIYHKGNATTWNIVPVYTS